MIYQTQKSDMKTYIKTVTINGKKETILFSDISYERYIETPSYYEATKVIAINGTKYTLIAKTKVNTQKRNTVTYEYDGCSFPANDKVLCEYILNKPKAHE